ncbi:N-acetyltransferase 9 [Balamuthia mandrillaris]
MTIEEEYKNRQGWATDLHRFTFIVLDKTLPETNETNQHTTQHYAMAGDVNLFLDTEEHEQEEQEQEEEQEGKEESNGEKESPEGEPNSTAAGGGTIVTGEINLMTAEERSRRKGLAGESLLLMMEWGMRQLAVQKVLAKINTNNEPSIRLFEREGFVEVGRSEIFQEVSLELDVREGTAARQRVLRAVAELQTSVQPYCHNNN